MKALTTAGLTKLIQLIKSSFISNSDTVTTNTVTLADVATSGDYDDLINQPTIPTVGNGIITINQGGTQKGTFTVNQSGNTTINLDAGGGGAVDSVNGQTGTVVLTASDVGALSDTVTIPTKTSDLTNDNGFITSSALSNYVTDTSLATTLSDYVLSSDLATTLTDYQPLLDTVTTNTVTLATVATSGSYNDLINQPTIPTVDQTYDGTSTNAQSGVAIEGAGFLKNNATGTNSINILGVSNNYNYQTVIGSYARAYLHSVAVGYRSISGAYCVAIGSEAAASGNDESIAIGRNAEVAFEGNYSIQLGNGTNSTPYSFAIGFNGTNYQLLDGTTGLIPDARISSNIARTSEIPTKTSDLTNDSGFITNTVNNLTNYYLKTETYTKLEVQQLIASIPQFSVEVVQSLPVTGERMVLYLVPKVGESPDVYEEYIWVEDDSQFELIGSTAIDLSDYVTNEDLSTALSDYVTNNDLATALADYVTNSDLNTTLADYVTTNDLATVATTGDYDDLINKPTIPTVNNGTLTISRNYLPVGTFTANSSVNQTINISVPTATSQILNNTNLVSYQVNGTETLAPVGFTPDGKTFMILYVVGGGMGVGGRLYDLVYDGTYSYYGTITAADPSENVTGTLNLTLDDSTQIQDVLSADAFFQANTKYFAWYDNSGGRTIYTEVIQGISDVYTLENDEFVLQLSDADVSLSMDIYGSLTCTINQYGSGGGFICTPDFELNVLDYSDTTVDLLNASSEVIATIPSNIVTSVNNIQPVDGNVTITIPDTSSLADDTLSNVTTIDSNSAVQTALNGKQNTISDLATIRSGASAGATAVQPSTLTSYVAKSEVTYDSTTSTLYIGVSQS